MDEAKKGICDSHVVSIHFDENGPEDIGKLITESTLISGKISLEEGLHNLFNHCPNCGTRLTHESILNKVNSTKEFYKVFKKSLHTNSPMIIEMNPIAKRTRFQCSGTEMIFINVEFDFSVYLYNLAQSAGYTIIYSNANN